MKKNIVNLLLMLVFALSAKAQIPENSTEDIRIRSNTYSLPPSEREPEEVIFEKPEVGPEFPDGQAAVFKWISQHVHYPPVARENNIQGTSRIKFVVEKDGRINNLEIVGSSHELLDKEAIIVLQRMPKWKPAKQGGKIVRSYFTLPVAFKLEG